jgi:5'(3')-deoxyribonucleotidase
MCKIKIGLDIDDTLLDFVGEYLKIFKSFDNDHTITKNVNKLRLNKKFWENLPKLRSIDFEPTLYCTKRINPKSYTRNSLIKNGFPIKPIYQMYHQQGNKAVMIKGKVDVFIDDSISNFKMMNNSGVMCLLITTKHNKNFKTNLRIDNLQYETILNKYNEYKDNFSTVT